MSTNERQPSQPLTRPRRWPALAWAPLLLLPWAGVTADEELRLATIDWDPFYAEDVPEQGFITAIAREALDRAGYDSSVDFIPWERAMYDVEQGVRDVLLGAYYSDERAETFAFSDSMYDTEIGLVALEDLGRDSYDSLRDLTDYTIGYGRGWAHGEEFDEADYLDKVPEDDNVLNVRKLYADRIDMIAKNRDRFFAIVEDEGYDPERAVFLEPPLEQSGLYMAFSRELEDVDEIVADFNAALAEMREDGTYDEILDRLAPEED